MSSSKDKRVYIKVLFFIVGIGLLFDIVRAIGDLGDYPEKIWLHRCNSVEKLVEKHDKYPNIEVDIVFRENGKFDVTHDLDKSYGLDLRAYCLFMQKLGGRMWLDIKNMTEENSRVMLDALEQLLDLYHISKENLIIESSSWKPLALFTRNGYYTSFYVPFDKPSRLDDEQIQDCIEDLQEIVDSKAVKALSFPYWWYSDIKENLHRPVDLLTWAHRSTQLQLLLSPRGRKMLNDDQLKVILVKEKGDYHR